MKNSLIYIILLIAGIAISRQGYAQTAPVNATLQLTPPYSIYLPDYAVAGSTQMKLNLLLRDLNEPMYEVRLHLVVEGVGIRIETNPSFNPQPIVLEGGVPSLLNGEDLAPYLDSRNLLFNGISRQQYEQRASLPEGFYRFCVRVLDYRRPAVALSREACATAWFVLNDPPRINQPQCGTTVPLRDPQNIFFQWLPMNSGSPNSALSTEYEFTLVEVRPAGRNPNDAINTSVPIFQETVQETSLVYGLTEPPLIPGQEYAFRIRAKDSQGRDLFKNRGYSEVCTFKFGEMNLLTPPEQINVYPETERRAKVTWYMNLEADRYRVEYRKKATGTDQHAWFSRESAEDYVLLNDLDGNTDYEVRVAGVLRNFTSAFTEPVSFRTPVPRVFVCGESGGEVVTQNTRPLITGMVGQRWKIGKFEMLIESVIGGDGVFSGIGAVIVPYLGFKVYSKFERIQVNENQEVIRGEVIALSEDWETFKERWAPEDPAPENNDTPLTPETQQPGSTPFVGVDVPFSGEIATVTVNAEGAIVIVDTAGEETTIQQPVNQSTGEKENARITDSAGNQWVVQKDPKTGETTVTKVEGGGSNQGSSTSPTATPKEKKLIAEILKRFENQIASVLNPVREPVFPRGAGPVANDFYEPAPPSCMPEDQDQLKIIKDYLSKISNDGNALDAFINAVYQNESDKQTIVSIAAKTSLADNQKFEDVLSIEDLQKVESSLCSHTVEEAKEYVARLWWLAPYWERAAKILKEHFEDVGLYEDVTVECSSTYCKTIGIIKIAEGATATIEVTFSDRITPADTWEILTKHGVDFWEGRSITLESFKERFWNYMAMKDDHLYQGKGWESETLKIFADVLMAGPGTVQGWVTGKHWRTGDELAMWEHVLGVLDVIPAETLAKAGITAFVIKIGGKLIDVTKFTQPVKNFILSAYSSGLKLLVKSKDEIVIFASNGSQQIGRLLNGVLQDLYWVYGGERIIARLAGVKYMMDPTTQKVVDGTLEIAEDASTVGARINREVGKVIYLTTKINGATVVRIMGGNNGKVALIGRKMSYIEEVAEALKKLGKEVEIFDINKAFGGQGYKDWASIKANWDDALRQFGILDGNGNKVLPYDKVKSTLWYKENERWAKWIKESGFDIYDLGDNPGSLRNAPDRSAFYDLEKITIFND